MLCCTEQHIVFQHVCCPVTLCLTCPLAQARDKDGTIAVMSSNGETNVVLRGVTHGAVDFLIKPVRIEELRNVWQHVVRRKRDQVITMFLSRVCIFLHCSIFLGCIACALDEVIIIFAPSQATVHVHS